MSKRFGRSAYLTTFEQHKESFITNEGSEYIVFTSFHIDEEIKSLGAQYRLKATQFIAYFHGLGYKIIADISPRTFDILEVTSFNEFLLKYPIDIVRPDFGFSHEELISMASIVPVMINASMLDVALWNALQAQNNLSALHNFYPRPETGLDEELFQHLNQELQDRQIDVYAFVPGNSHLRGPIHAGLPTLEHHRHAAVYACCIDLWWTFGVQGVLVGDMGIDELTLSWIDHTLQTDHIVLPIELSKEYSHLHQQTFTIRIDSPKWTARFLESRQYATKGEDILPLPARPRPRGTLTIDNRLYDRYTGEIQLVKEDLPSDSRINVIGLVPEPYHLLLDNIKNGSKITLYQLT